MCFVRIRWMNQVFFVVSIYLNCLLKHKHALMFHNRSNWQSIRHQICCLSGFLSQRYGRRVSDKHFLLLQTHEQMESANHLIRFAPNHKTMWFFLYRFQCSKSTNSSNTDEIISLQIIFIDYRALRCSAPVWDSALFRVLNLLTLAEDTVHFLGVFPLMSKAI